MDFSDQKKIMSRHYWDLWNADEQARIDEDIERNRKADAAIALGPDAAGAKVSVRQTKSDFFFGAHIFNFNQLGSHELNERYKALYGDIFNAATAAFYWDPFEPEEGRMRFEESPGDDEAFWNACKNPAAQRFWRRPCTDPVIDFLTEKGLRVHAHPMVWTNRTWHYPKWLLAKLPKEMLVDMISMERQGDNLRFKTPAEIEKLAPEFVGAFRDALERRISAIAGRYGEKIDSVDAVNESAVDFAARRRGVSAEDACTREDGALDPSLPICTAAYQFPTFMPPAFDMLAFDLCHKYFPASTKLNINDYNMSEAYREQTRDLLARGRRVDLQGLQMHLFNPDQCARIAAGSSDEQAPWQARRNMATVDVGLPQVMSELTITSAGEGERGEAIQSVIAYNLYRLWFSRPKMRGITWWNAVDGCGAPGEPSISGICRRDMTPKLVYHTFDRLFNHEWRTSLELTAGEGGALSFRGFKGTYELSWEDASGSHRKTLAVR